MKDNQKKKPYYKFNQNKKCEYFPCHKTNKIEEFNCLFCYCPLYALADKCGGNFKITDNGIKDCSQCMMPHVKDNYGLIVGKYGEIGKLVQEQLEKNKEDK